MEALASSSIVHKELFRIAVAAHVWGERWARLKVEFLCDNVAVDDVLNSCSSRDNAIIHLVRRLTLVYVPTSFFFSARHVPVTATPSLTLYHVFISRNSTVWCLYQTPALHRYFNDCSDLCPLSWPRNSLASLLKVLPGGTSLYQLVHFCWSLPHCHTSGFFRDHYVTYGL